MGGEVASLPLPFSLLHIDAGTFNLGACVSLCLLSPGPPVHTHTHTHT